MEGRIKKINFTGTVFELVDAIAQQGIRVSSRGGMSILENSRSLSRSTAASLLALTRSLSNSLRLSRNRDETTGEKAPLRFAAASHHPHG